MKRMTCLAVVMVAIGNVAFADLSDYTWHEYNGHKYAITLAYNNWVNAEAEAVAVGGHLATINDASENSWLSQTFKGYYPQGGYTGPDVSLVWIGFLLQDGEWGWISGEPVTFPPPWYDGGPIHNSIHAYLHTDTHYQPGTWWEDPPYDVDPYWYVRGIIELNPVAVPAPAAVVLASMGLGFAGWRLRRRRMI